MGLRTRMFIQSIFVFSSVMMLSGCPAALQDIIDSTRSSLNEESATYQLVVDAQSQDNGAVLKRLESWNSALRRIATNLNRIINHFEGTPEDRAQAGDKLTQLKEKLDVILDRQVDLTLVVPIWDVHTANREIENLQENLQKVKTGYESLYDLTAAATSYSIRAQEDPAVVDARPLCLERFHVATLGDNQRSVCLNAAQSELFGCSHMMDMDCIDAMLLSAQGERFMRGSMCAELIIKVIDNPETGEHRVIQETMPLGWLDHIRNCQTSTPLRK